MEKRTVLYDWVKVIAIILVVVAHSTRMYTNYGAIPVENESIFLARFTEYVYQFHMPLFFFVTGSIFDFCLQKGKYENSIAFILNKTKRLLLPYFIFGFFYVAPVMQWLHLDEQGYWEYCLKGIIFSRNSRHLWYLFALFWIFMFCIILKKLIKKHSVCFLIISMGVLVVFYINSISFPFQITVSWHYQIYFVMGIYFNYFYEKIEFLFSKYKILGIFFAFILMGRFIYNPNIVSNMLYEFIGIFMIFFLAYHLQEKYMSKRKVFYIFSTIKRNLFGVYLFHPMIIYILFYYLGKSNMEPLFFSLVVALIALIVSIGLTKVVRKCNLQVIIGE